MSRFIELFERWQAGAADPALEQELRAQIDRQPERLRQILGHYRMERLLRELPAAGDGPTATARRRAFVDRVIGELRTGMRRRRKRRRSWAVPVLSAAAACLAIGLAVFAMNRNREASATVWGKQAWTTGAARLQRDGRNSTLAAIADLRPGDRLMVQRALALHDARGATLELAAGSQLTLHAGPVPRCTLHSGRLRATVEPQTTHPAWAIATPHATLSVLGTRFTIVVDAAATRLAVETGAVRVATGDGSSSERVAAGESLRATTTGLAREPQLIARWTFDATDGRTTPDVSGNGHRLQTVSDARWGEGLAGGGARLDGEGVLHVEDHDAFDLNAATLCLWLKPAEPLPAQFARLDQGMPMEFISKMDWQAKAGYELVHPAFAEADTWRVRIGHGDALTAAARPAPDGTGWIHLAASWEPGGAVRLHVDGVAVASTPLAAQPVTANAATLAIANRFAGWVDDVRIYDGVLSDQALAAIVSARAAP